MYGRHRKQCGNQFYSISWEIFSRKCRIQGFVFKNKVLDNWNREKNLFEMEPSIRKDER
jgi:hypothetical protein